MEIPLADVLSRVTPTPVEEDGIQLPIVAVNPIMSNLPFSSTEIELIHGETSKDPTLHKNFTHFGAIEKTYPWKTDLSPKEPDSSYLPH